MQQEIQLLLLVIVWTEVSQPSASSLMLMSVVQNTLPHTSKYIVHYINLNTHAHTNTHTRTHAHTQLLNMLPQNCRESRRVTHARSLPYNLPHSKMSHAHRGNNHMASLTSGDSVCFTNNLPLAQQNESCVCNSIVRVARRLSLLSRYRRTQCDNHQNSNHPGRLDNSKRKECI